MSPDKSPESSANFHLETHSLQQKIEQAYLQSGSEIFQDESLLLALDTVMDGLEQGILRVASFEPNDEPNDEPSEGEATRGKEPHSEPLKRQASGQWRVHEWLKKAILLHFRRRPTERLEVSPGSPLSFSFVDKIAVRQWTGQEGVRVVPPAVARRGAFIDQGVILMPSFVNVGAYVGSGTMVDTWATVGSCAQIGKRVHLSGGVGIGGVLEPLQNQPVIIEDDVFIGSRCVVAEGVRVEEGAVLGAGVVLTASTRILDVYSSSQPIEYRGRVPRNSVVIPGAALKQFAAGEFSVAVALIIGERSAQTDRKTSLNQLLRDFPLFS